VADEDMRDIDSIIHYVKGTGNRAAYRELGCLLLSVILDPGGTQKYVREYMSRWGIPRDIRAL
jgi:hypothetical protein